MFGGETGRHGRGSQTIVLSLRVEQASGGTLPETEAPSPAPRGLFPAGSPREAALSSSPGALRSSEAACPRGLVGAPCALLRSTVPGSVSRPHVIPRCPSGPRASENQDAALNFCFF